MIAGLPRRLSRLLVPFALAHLPAQIPCGFQALPGPALPGSDGPVHRLQRWDPDGPGPQPPLVPPSAPSKHQFLALELGTAGALAAIRSSNALRLQIGAL
jgi:hypothetical protein